MPIRGRWIHLSPMRRLVSDIAWLARRTPIGVLRRTINIAPVMAERRLSGAAIPWTVIFVKGYALVLQDMPPLRRNYVGFPWPHLHETETSVAMIVTERIVHGEPAVYPVRIREPAARDLSEMAATLLKETTAPSAELPKLRFAIRISRLPLLIRRALWLFAFNVGRLRMDHFASFGISVLGHRGVYVNYPVSALTTFITYGPFAANGDVELMMSFDHRAMDAAIVCDAMAALEEKLNGVIARELRALGAATVE